MIKKLRELFCMLIKKLKSNKEYRNRIIPTILLACVILFALAIRMADIKWNIKDHPAFAYSNHDDELAEMRGTVNFNIRDLRLTESRELMIKGAFFHMLSKITYDVVRTTFLNNAFELVCHHEITSPTGQYCFFRSIVILSSILLVYLIYRLGKALTDNKYTGILAACIFSTIFSSTFYSVIYKSTMFAVVCVTFLMLLAVSYGKKPSLLKAIAMGVVFSLCFAVRFDTAFALFLVITAFAVQWIKEKKIPFLNGVASSVSSAISIVIFAPFISLNFEVFKKGLEIQKTYQTSRSFHFEEFGFQPVAIITHLFERGMGPILTLFVVLSVVFMAYIFVKKKMDVLKFLPLIVFLMVQYTVLSTNTWIVTRYTIVLFPILCIFVSILIIEVYKFLLKSKKGLRYIGISLMALLIPTHLLWFLAFNNLLTDTTTTVEAANWIKENIPSDKTILNNAMQSGPPSVYGFGDHKVIEFSYYDMEDAVRRWKSFDDFGGDYIITSQRSFRQFYRLKSRKYERYRRFYDLILHSDKFTIVKKFERKAQIFGITFDKGFLPQDLVLISPDVYIIKRNAQVEQIIFNLKNYLLKKKLRNEE